MPSSPKYIDADSLAALLRDPTLQIGKDFVVVDVRGDDFANGNIRGAVNVPSHEFLEDPAAYVEKFKDVPKVVFHCALSQVRGPKCAQRYAQALEDGVAKAAIDGSLPSEVLILRGGFENWQSGPTRRDLIESYNEEFWKNPYF
ncbi:Rhodanese-like domain-containing protein [Fimicolochytrium jonesii]|uniref:Rhodanese-like domain-containing protein n=1 Tax=Fimicolochytrium jonesii TaxID=1396493 RepID=UPI0022FEF080|nr:Rhodanese-like domain-containing protein [Fimicolochytrium jonesii]KAI8824503.1 Rhodanese-like domain-containing protein [Fimicolochytrium jonesii]